MTVSVAIVARDEADRIAACLESLTFSDEVLVLVDSRSQDDTFAIAQSYGCRVERQEWLGYARQKQSAVDRCKHDWVLILDADERVPEAAGHKIALLTESAHPDTAAYALLRKSIFHGRWIRRCGWWPDRVVRLVDRRQGAFNNDLVHEQWLSDGKVEDPGLYLEHHSFRNYAHLIDKMQNYSALAALQMAQEGRRANWWTALSHGAWTFIRTWLLKLGILEGFDGFMISTLNAGGTFMKYAKLMEMNLYDKTDAGKTPAPRP